MDSARASRCRSTPPIGFMDPEAVLKLVDKPAMHALGKEVRARLQRVCDSLKA